MKQSAFSFAGNVFSLFVSDKIALRDVFKVSGFTLAPENYVLKGFSR